MDNGQSVAASPVEGAAVKPTLHRAWLRDGAIGADATWEQISREVYEGRIVILKGAYDAERMIRFRESVVRWGRDNAVFPHGPSPGAQPELNYHRIDDGVIKSVCPHVLHQYGFKAISRLEGEIRPQADEIATTMKDVQNHVARTDLQVSASGLYLKVLHYPPGGFLAGHTHPLRPQGIGLILSLSRIGTDVTRGGTTFETPFGFVDASSDHDLGDILIFRYDLRHGVPPVDPDRKLDWDSPLGKWSVVLELRETYGLSHKKS